MGTQEWLLLGIVLVVPLIVAVVVTLWTLEQAIKRNRKNQRGRVARRVSEPVVDSVAEPVVGSEPARPSPTSDTVDVSTRPREEIEHAESEAARSARAVSRET